MVAGDVGNELSARLKVKLSVSSQFKSEALEGEICQCKVEPCLMWPAYPSSRIAPYMIGTALIEPCSPSLDKLHSSTMTITTHRAIPVDSRLSDIGSINDNVIRNTSTHQIKGSVRAHARHLSSSRTIGTACRIEKGGCLGFDLL